MLYLRDHMRSCNVQCFYKPMSIDSEEIQETVSEVRASPHALPPFDHTFPTNRHKPAIEEKLGRAKGLVRANEGS